MMGMLIKIWDAHTGENTFSLGDTLEKWYVWRQIKHFEISACL